MLSSPWNPDQVTDLSWTYDGSTVTLQKDGESNWSYPDEAFPLDAAYPDAMVQALSEVEAAQDHPGPRGPGLLRPGGGGVHRLRHRRGGNPHPDLRGRDLPGGPAVPLPGRRHVYLVDSTLLDDFALGLYDLVEEETIPSMADLTNLSIETSGGTLSIDYQEEGGLAYCDQYTWFWDQEGSLTALDSSLTQSLVDTVHGPDLERPAWTIRPPRTP